MRKRKHSKPKAKATTHRQVFVPGRRRRRFVNLGLVLGGMMALSLIAQGWYNKSEAPSIVRNHKPPAPTRAAGPVRVQFPATK